MRVTARGFRCLVVLATLLLAAGCSSQQTLPAARASAVAEASWAILRSRAVPPLSQNEVSACTAAVSKRFDVQIPTGMTSSAPQKVAIRSLGYAGDALVRVRAVGAGPDGQLAVAPATELAADAQVAFTGNGMEVFMVRVAVPGCYALQVDAPGFTEVFLFLAQQAPIAKPQAVAMTAREVPEYLRTRVTGVHPLFLPQLPPDWLADVTADAAAFSADYSAPDGSRRFLIATMVANPPPLTMQRQPSFHGDPRSLYEWSDTQRMLDWREPKSRWTSAFAPGGEVEYYVTAAGYSDAEFWAVVGALQTLVA